VELNEIVDPEDEDPAFFQDFMRVIDDARLKHSDDISNVEVTLSVPPYVGMELALTRGGEGEPLHARVRGRLHDEEGNPIGHAHHNPLLRLAGSIEVEYVNGYVEELTANVTLLRNLDRLKWMMRDVGR
jgi:hypothetical protein